MTWIINQTNKHTAHNAFSTREHPFRESEKHIDFQENAHQVSYWHTQWTNERNDEEDIRKSKIDTRREREEACVVRCMYACTLINEECSIALEHNLHIFSVDSFDISFSNTNKNKWTCFENKYVCIHWIWSVLWIKVSITFMFVERQRGQREWPMMATTTITMIIMIIRAQP